MKDAIEICQSILVELGETDCLHALGRAALEDDTGESWAALAQGLRDGNRPLDAISAYRRAIERQGDSDWLWAKLAAAYLEAGQLARSADAYRRAYDLSAEDAGLLFNEGTVRLMMHSLRPAHQAFLGVLQKEPEHVGAWSNMGATAKLLGDWPAALDCYRRATELAPTDADAAWNRAVLEIANGEYRSGWSRFSAREHIPGLAPRKFPELIRWGGEPLDEGSLLVHAEQGLGDTLQFMRYVKFAQERVPRVVVACQRPLVDLIRAAFTDCEVVELGGFIGATHEIPIFSLPALLGEAFSHFANHIPYLKAPPQSQATWQGRLQERGDFSVGICWQGNPSYREDRLRSVPLRFFYGLGKMHGVSLYTLQKRFGLDQLSQVPDKDSWLTDLTETLDEETPPFIDSAGLISCLDLVITSDTSVAHLAGAMGRPVWLLLAFVADWRWGTEGVETPWYPGMRLYRQSQPGDWREVLSRVERDLRKQLGL